MLDEEVQYRLLSAVAHGHSWAITRLGFQPVKGTVGSSQIGGVSVSHFEKTPNFKGIALLGITAAKSLSRAIWNQARYLGWDEEKLVRLFDKTFDNLQALPVVRFWKTPTT